MSAHNFIDLTGQRFERLVVQSRVENTPDGKARWQCLCDCGTTVIVTGKELRTTRHPTRSCGCANVDRIRMLNRSHGMSHTVEYAAWTAIKTRCNNPNGTDYHLYGGRGIRICEEWDNSFERFYQDIGPRPTPEHSLDRYPDPNGPYAPENCRWATQVEQANNTRTNRYVVYEGKTFTVAELARHLGLPQHTILYHNGQPLPLSKHCSLQGATQLD